MFLEEKNVLVAKFTWGREPYNRAGDRGLDKSNSVNIKHDDST